MISRYSKVYNSACSLFPWLFYGPVVWPRLGDTFISQNPIAVCVSFSRIDSRFYIDHLFVWSNLDFLHNSQWITLPTQLCLVSYFYDYLLQSHIMWLIVSFLLPHNLHLQFCSVLFILALIWFVLKTLFCVVIKRDSVSFLRFPLLNHVGYFSYDMSLVSRLKRP